MKLIPALTLTTLAAAASAQTAPAAAPAAKQSISYSRVIVSSVTQSGDGFDGVSVFAQAKLGNGLYLAGSATNLDNDGGADNVSRGVTLGYAYTLGSVLGMSTDLNIELGHDEYGVGIRTLISSGLDLGLAYTKADAEQQDVYTVALNYSLSQFVKGLSVNLSYADQRGSYETTSIGIGYNF